MPRLFSRFAASRRAESPPLGRYLLPIRLGISLLLLLGIAGGARHALGDEREAFFREQVEPILRKRCFGCHSHERDSMEGNLALDWRSGWEKGGDRGPAIIPGEPEKSLLLRAIRHEDAELMMPEEKLPEEEIAAIAKWIAAGAFDSREAKPVRDAASWWSLTPLRPLEAYDLSGGGGTASS